MIFKVVPPLFALLLCSFTIGQVGRIPAATQQLKPTYEIYALRYATIPDFPVSELVAGADKSRKINIAMMVWLLKGASGRNVLVDSGFYREKFFKTWNVKDFVKPSEALARLKLKPEDITDIIITHLHWDHADGVDLFPKAHIWIQKDELGYYQDKSRQIDGVDAEDISVLVKLNNLRRLTLVDGDTKEPIPGVTVYTGGRHTYASQYVAVKTKTSAAIIASDNVYLYENLEKHLPIAWTFDAAANLAAQDRMKTIVSDPRLIVPGHDPDLFERFPLPGNGVAKIE